MPKYLRFFLKQNCRIILRVFGHMKGEKKSFFIIFLSFYLDFIWQKPIFLKIKTVKIGLRGVFAKHTLKHKHPLKPKKPLAKVL